MQQWEHRLLIGTTDLDWPAALGRFGAEGWTVATYSPSPPVAILQRPLVPPDPLPTGTPAEWYPDPCGRWERRYWNGLIWTAHVVNDSTKERGIDVPQTLPSSD